MTLFFLAASGDPDAETLVRSMRLDRDRMQDSMLSLEVTGWLDTITAPELLALFKEAAKELMGLGIQEVNHAGFYATLNGKYPKDEKQFWKLIKGLSSAEYKGETTIGKIAEALKAEGLAEASEDVSYFALQEKHHGIKTRDMYDKYAPKEEGTSDKVYVCSVCGFVYEGDLDAEPADFKCPLCGCGKGVFKLQ